MRIVTWNIRHGGPRGSAGQLMIATLLAFDADVLVVTEFRNNAAGMQLIVALENARYQTSNPGADPTRNSVLIASRLPIQQAGPLDPALPLPHRLWLTDFGDTRLVGVYMPTQFEKIPYFEALLAAAAKSDAPDLYIGDFNNGKNDLDREPKGAPFGTAGYMDSMEAAGLIDLWRLRHGMRREYTWFSSYGRNGFRLDHAFGSVRSAALLRECIYDHTPRLARLSDHSAMVLDFDAT